MTSIYEPSGEAKDIRKFDYKIRDAFRELEMDQSYYSGYHRSLMEAYDSIDESVQVLTNFCNWNMGELQRDEEVMERGENRNFRRPKIVVNVGYGEHFGRDKNLVVLVNSPKEYERDYRLSLSRYEAKVLTIEDFRSVVEDAKDERESETTRALASALARLTANILDHVVLKLSAHCDVEVGDRLRLMLDENRLVSTWTIVTGSEAAQEREQARLGEVARRTQVQAEVIQRRQDKIDAKAAEELARLEAFEDTYGMAPEKFVGYVQALKTKRLKFNAIVQILADQHGLKEAIWENFAQKLNETRSTLIANERTDWPSLDENEIRELCILSFGKASGFQNLHHEPRFKSEAQKTFKP